MRYKIILMIIFASKLDILQLYYFIPGVDRKWTVGMK